MERELLDREEREEFRRAAEEDLAEMVARYVQAQHWARWAEVAALRPEVLTAARVLRLAHALEREWAALNHR
jgi:hypothetical protein